MSIVPRSQAYLFCRLLPSLHHHSLRLPRLTQHVTCMSKDYHSATHLISKMNPVRTRLAKRPGSSLERYYQTLECEPDHRQPQTGKSKPTAPLSPGGIDTMQINLTDPRTIVKHLDEYVIGQEQGKKILAVAVYNHYCRVQANLAKQEHDRLEMEDRNLVEQHHSTLPQDYYTSTPIESVGADLVPAERLSSYGKLSQRRAWLNPPSQTATHHRLQDDMDIDSGSSLNKQPDLLDDAIIHDKSNVLIIGPTGTGKTLMTKTLAKVLGVPFSSNDATPLTMAGYVGEDVDVVIHRLLESCDYDVKKAETGIVFIDEIDKIARRTGSSSQSKDVSGEGVQQSLLRLLEGTKVTIPGGNGSSRRPGGPLGYMKSDPITVDTSNILFILSGAFIGLDEIVKDRLAKGSIGFDAVLKSKSEETVDIKQGDTTLSVPPLQLVEPEDLVKFGFIPEFVGRVPVLASVAHLQVGDLVRILSEPKNCLVKQYKDLFKLSDVDLHLNDSALRQIAELALEKKTGARGLRRIMEQLLLDLMYDTPSSTTASRLWFYEPHTDDTQATSVYHGYDPHFIPTHDQTLLTEASPIIPGISITSRRNQDWSIFFDPAGVDRIYSLQPELGHTTKIAAIDDTTAAHLQQLGCHVHAVASTPDAIHLLEAIVDYDKNR